MLQAVYADLLDRCRAAAFDEAFPKEGAFTSKIIRGRRFWYFQTTTDAGRAQQYAGPETPELLDHIASHRAGRHELRDRRAIVSTLVRSARMPQPSKEIGDVVAALAKAGVFRLNAVLIGTVAYQTYAAMLGVRLRGAAERTDDVDVARSADVSIAVDDNAPNLYEILRKANPSFRRVPSLHRNQSTTYETGTGVRVDFLTPNRGRESEEPVELAALQTHAQPLRFLDFLIRDPEPAALLHEEGVAVQVPAPQRYALHKLILARRRKQGPAKIDKDLRQAQELLRVLVRKRPYELRAAWDEARARGPKWRLHLGEGLGMIDPDIRDQVLKGVGAVRSIIPNLDLAFTSPAARYDSERDAVTFTGLAEVGAANGVTVRCVVSREAFEDALGVETLTKESCLRLFRKNRATIQSAARAAYLDHQVSEPGLVLLDSAVIPRLPDDPKRP